MDSLDWHTDILGADFQALDLPSDLDPEGEGNVHATLVRHQPEGVVVAGRPALLWVHGMTDYFFQAHVAAYFTAHGYAFYALDLRKCGRSRLSGQRWHYSEDLRHYFPDLDKAKEMLLDAHPTLVPLAHSTGGLIVPLWLSQLRSRAGIRGLVLNSPWLDMMYPRALVFVMTIIARAPFPGLAIPGGNLSAYGMSLRDSEWDFDLQMKPLGGHKKYLGWLRAILEGQKQIHSGGVDVAVPVLTLLSTCSFAADTSDLVLDVEQIARWAPALGADVTLAPIEGARHDVFLSRTPAREQALATTLAWLKAH